MKSLPADNIHQRLCDLRNGTEKTQKEVADELNIQASVLSRIERGETKAVSHDLVIKFAEYYNVSTDYLLCISDVRLRRNVELEQLGLTNKALLHLLQGKMDGNILSKMLEHPYFPVLLDTANAYFAESHNSGFAARNAIIDIGTADIKDFIKEHPEQKQVELPETLEGKPVSWRRPEENRGYVILGLGLVGSILLILLEKETQKEEMKKKKKQR